MKGTKYMKLTLIIDDLPVIKWWVDASDGTHHDYKGHSGIMMTLGGVGGDGKYVNQPED